MISADILLRSRANVTFFSSLGSDDTCRVSVFFCPLDSGRSLNVVSVKALSESSDLRESWLDFSDS